MPSVSWESSASSAQGEWTTGSIPAHVPSPGTNPGHRISLYLQLLVQPSSGYTQAEQCDLCLKDSNCTIESMSLCQELCIGAALQCQQQGCSGSSSHLNPPRPTDILGSVVPQPCWCWRGTMGLEIAKHLQAPGIWVCWKSDAANSLWSLTNGEKMVFIKHCKSFALFIGSMAGILTDWSPKIPVLVTEAVFLSFVSSRSLE